MSKYIQHFVKNGKGIKNDELVLFTNPQIRSMNNNQIVNQIKQNNNVIDMYKSELEEIPINKQTQLIKQNEIPNILQTNRNDLIKNLSDENKKMTNKLNNKPLVVKETKPSIMKIKKVKTDELMNEPLNIISDDKNIQMKDVKRLIEEYDKNNFDVKFDIKEIPKEYQNIVNKINKKEELIWNVSIYNEKTLNKASEIRDYFPSGNNINNISKDSLNYMNNVNFEYVLNGKIQKYNMFSNEELKKKEYESPGKPAEYAICGLNNQLAKKIFNVKNPNVQITDFLVNNIYSNMTDYKSNKDELSKTKINEIIKNSNKKGSQFICDNIDVDNGILNEMKYYQNINYINMIYYNSQLRRIYYNELKNELKDVLFEKYNDVNDEIEIEMLKQESKKKLKDLLSHKQDIQNEIDNLINILTNNEEFSKSFYKNKKYLSIGITINKFLPVEVPKGNDLLNSPNSKEKIEKLKRKQGQKYVMECNKDRYITKITEKLTTNNKTQKKYFDKVFNEKYMKKPMKYTITTVCKNEVCMYDFTNDKLIDKDNNILSVYRIGYSSDAQGLTEHNAVLIPIERCSLINN